MPGLCLGSDDSGDQIIPYTDVNTIPLFLFFKAKAEPQLLSIASEVCCERRMGLLLKVVPFMKVVGFKFHMFLSISFPTTVSSTFYHAKFF